MEKKITKREMFATMKELFAENMSEMFDVFGTEDTKVSGEDMVQFLDHEIELLSRKRSGKSKPTKTQLENEKLTEIVLEVLTEDKERKALLTDEEKGEDFHEGMKIVDILKARDEFVEMELSTNRLTPMLTKLIKAGKGEKTIEKTVRFYNAL